MNDLTDEVKRALKVVTSSRANCEKLQYKFAEGSSQLSLSRNRIKALTIAECLLKDDEAVRHYSLEELEKALPPICSIRNKTTNARKKHEAGGVWYRRMTPIIEAMDVCEALLRAEIARRDDAADKSES